ncbi:MAG: CAP domain-containing protein [Alistipes sp.]|nr:CAP domain-containing protein [Alistipes sp.]
MMNAAVKVIKKITAMVMTIAMTAAMAAANTVKAAESYDAEQLVNEIAIMVNEARAEAGLEPVSVLPYLNEVSEIRAIERAINYNRLGRYCTSFEAEIDTEVVDYRNEKINESVGTATAEETFAAWKADAEQWAAIMTAEVTHMGVGVIYDEDTEYGWYWEQTLIETDMEFEDEYIPGAIMQQAEIPQVQGDITGDGVVNTYDYLVLAGYLTGSGVQLSEAQLEMADCFRDGIITEADAKVLAQYILGECAALPYIY